MYRIKQFLWALAASLMTNKRQEGRLDEIKRLLGPDELELFRAMSIADQDHSFRVYQTVRERVGRDGEELEESGIGPVDINSLFKASLLHDIGRDRDNFSFWAKVYCVIIDRIMRLLSIDIEGVVKNKSNKIARRLKVYYQHPDLSIKKLEKIWAKLEKAEREQEDTREISSATGEQVVDYKQVKYLILNHHKEGLTFCKDENNSNQINTSNQINAIGKLGLAGGYSEGKLGDEEAIWQKLLVILQEADRQN